MLIGTNDSNILETNFWDYLEQHNSLKGKICEGTNHMTRDMNEENHMIGRNKKQKHVGTKT
jgi:hypothetical protein